MERFNVRITNVEIENFKNVKYGNISMEGSLEKREPSILGLYGQNGSGKTALIDTLNLLKHILSGLTIPNYYGDYINVENEYSTIKYNFEIINEVSQEIRKLYYKCSIKKVSEEVDTLNGKKYEDRVQLFDEEIKYSFSSDEKNTIAKYAITTKDFDIFGPKIRYDTLVGLDKTLETDLIVAKKLADKESSSFVFSLELIQIIEKRLLHYRDNLGGQKKTDVFEISNLLLILLVLKEFAFNRFFIVDMEDFGATCINMLPLVLRYLDGDKEKIESTFINLEKKNPFSVSQVKKINETISGMNIVLQEIIPGLTIEVKDLGADVLDDGAEGRAIQLLSKKNAKAIPLRMESDGIKRIVSILQLLIGMFNNQSITIVIDELDIGIFEYMLGELLEIISRRAKGQLIFTCHNLRPLETIDSKFIAFTTTDETNVYYRPKNIKKTHNLRDRYYRNIILHGEPRLYSKTSNQKIAFAFMEAGEDFE